MGGILPFDGRELPCAGSVFFAATVRVKGSPQNRGATA
jgi:hypothetical protein